MGFAEHLVVEDQTRFDGFFCRLLAMKYGCVVKRIGARAKALRGLQIVPGLI